MTNNQLLIELNHNQYNDNAEIYMHELTNQCFNIIKDIDPSDFDRIQKLKEAVSQFGKKEQQTFWTFNTGLKGLLERQIQDTQEIKQSTQLLQELQLCVLKIKPPKKTFLQGFMNMFKLLFSVKETAWEMWLESYPNHKQHIDTITAQLENKKIKLNRNNSLLTKDKDVLNNHIVLLEKCYDMISHFEKLFSQTISNDKGISTDHQKIMLDDIIPIIKQRIIEQHQQLLIARQAAMTLDLFVSQNKSQIRGIDQAINTTTSAMEVTASIFVLKQSEIAINQSKTPNKNASNSFSSQKLKHARLMVDKALKQLEQAEIEANTIKKSESSIK